MIDIDALADETRRLPRLALMDPADMLAEITAGYAESDDFGNAVAAEIGEAFAMLCRVTTSGTVREIVGLGATPGEQMLDAAHCGAEVDVEYTYDGRAIVVTDTASGRIAFVIPA